LKENLARQRALISNIWHKCELQTSQTSCTAIRAEYLGRIYKTKFIDDPGIEDTREQSITLILTGQPTHTGVDCKAAQLYVSLEIPLNSEGLQWKTQEDFL